MEVIENYNFRDMCSSEHCDKEASHYLWLKWRGVKVLVILCKKHHDKILTRGGLENGC